jgi:phospholipid/cholesterol/gamma-HCH transport system ATP-binding protein
MREIIVSVQDVSFRFGKQLVHHDVSFDIFKGEIFGLIGPSGCGKSTIMRGMTLLQEPSKGEIDIFGKSVWGRSEDEAVALRKEWGVMFQNSALFSSLTVGENIAVALKEHTKMSASLVAGITATKLAMVGLEKNTLFKYPAELSGGMRKKVALARALAMDPKLLFLDEPTSSLDPVSAAEFDHLILSLKELLGLTIIMVSHDMRCVENTLDRMVVFVDKKIVACGTLKEVQKTQHPFISSFFKGSNL